MNVLVTGGTGFIGSNLVRRLLDAGNTVTVLDTALRSFLPNIDPRARLVGGKIYDDGALRWAFEEPPETVFHLAAHFANQKSIEEPEKNLMVNGMGTLKLLEYARKYDVSRVVYAGSGCSMPGSADEPMTEDEVSLKLDTPYKVTKMLGEMYFNLYATYGLPVTICRYFNVYGPGELPGKYRNVIPNFLWSAMHRRPLTITGTGDETRDFTYVGDIVEGTLLAAESKRAVGETFNLASGTETSVKRLIEVITSVLGTQDVGYEPRREWDRVARRNVSIYKARTVLGYEPKTALEEGIANTVAWLRAHEWEIKRWLRE